MYFFPPVRQFLQGCEPDRWTHCFRILFAGEYTFLLSYAITSPLIKGEFLTINAPLILKMRDIIFFLRANYIMGHFKGYFEGAKTFLRSGQFWDQKSRGPLEISREMAHYVVRPKPIKK